MRIHETAIPDVKILEPKKFGDARGFFSETWSRATFDKLELPAFDWMQDNHAYSASKGVLRGLHFQKPPYAQTKLVRCTRGSILDIAVDIRTGSPTYGRHVAAELSAENWLQILVPRGFAHAYLTLTDHCEVIYKVDNVYAPTHDAGLAWDDPALGIHWPDLGVPFTLSDKDRRHPTLAALGDVFSR